MTRFTRRKKVDPWKSQGVMVAAVVAVLFLFSIVVTNIQYSFSSEALFTKKAICYDSDSGKDFSKKGSVVIFTEDQAVASVINEDACIEGKLLEYFCESTERGYSSIEKECNCLEGRCVE